MLVLHVKKEEKTRGGIVIPATQKEGDIPKGVIIEMADDCVVDIKKGDLVYFEPHMVQRIYHPDGEPGKKEYLIIHENNIFG